MSSGPFAQIQTFYSVFNVYTSLMACFALFMLSQKAADRSYFRRNIPLDLLSLTSALKE